MNNNKELHIDFINVRSLRSRRSTRTKTTMTRYPHMALNLLKKAFTCFCAGLGMICGFYITLLIFLAI